MKNYILLILFATGFIAGCDNREDFFITNSMAPTIGIAKGDKVYSFLADSIKVTNPSQQYYPIEIRLGSKTSEINSLTYRISKGKGHLELREQKVLSNNLPSEYSAITVKYIPESLGEHELTFTAKNRFGAKSDLITDILFFKNLPPAAVFEIHKVDSGTKLEYLFDASKSSAGDAKFGGYLKKYIFKVNDQEYELKSDKFSYIFPTSGEYSIGLKVIDGDGESNEIMKTIKIEE